MISTKDADFPMSPKISDNISLGIDYRTQFLYSQQKNRTDFQNMSGSIYTNLALSKKNNVIGKIVTKSIVIHLLGSISMNIPSGDPSFFIYFNSVDFITGFNFK